MSKERIQELRELLFQMDGKIRPLQWDFDHKQINPFKKKEFERLTAQRLTLQEELESLQN